MFGEKIYKDKLSFTVILQKVECFLQNNHFDTKKYESLMDNMNILLQKYLVISSNSTFISPAHFAG